MEQTSISLRAEVYNGQYHGEVRPWGMWQCGRDACRWMISLRHGEQEAELSADVVLILPPQHVPKARRV